jgi:hypothetical protein
MCKNSVTVLMCHSHKLSDVIYTTNHNLYQQNEGYGTGKIIILDGQ